MKNSTLLNTTSSFTECTINLETVLAAWFATDLVTSLASFVGNILLIVVAYRARTRKTSTDYFIVSMAASDMFLPSFHLVDDIVLRRIDAVYISQTTGTVICKFGYFFTNISYGVSILSLIVIAVYRFYAVAFPMRARVQSRRTCIILLLLTWIFPIAMSSPWLFLTHFNSKSHLCFFELSTHHLRLLNVIDISLFFFVPLLVMLVLYPVILVKLRRQRIPRNAICSQAVERRRKQNFRLTTMFITITVAFTLCWGTDRVFLLIDMFLIVTDWCTFDKVYNAVAMFPIVFHAINHVIYFVFCSSYRQGLKQLLYCNCCRSHKRHAPGNEQIELGNIPEV